LEAVLEALDYVAQNRPLIEQERDREAAKLRAPGLGRARAGRRLLLDENMSDPRLPSRLKAQAHDPVLASEAHDQPSLSVLSPEPIQSCLVGRRARRILGTYCA
jgi:hypothetical protein